MTEQPNAQVLQVPPEIAHRHGAPGPMTEAERAFYDSMDNEQFETFLEGVRAEAARNQRTRGVGHSAMTGSGVGAGRRTKHGPAYRSQPGSGAYGH